MKTAVILFNLGGPDEQKAVRPFLFNLFNDAAIITLSQPFRWLLAQWISLRRAPIAKHIYQQMGGKSPILEFTREQAKALETTLAKKGDYKVFVSMRYWHPMSDVVIKNVKNYAPDHIILLPLYPQFSTTTTGSSFSNWDKMAAKAGLKLPTSKICCYPMERSFVAAHAKLIRESYWKAADSGKPRVLFSAHGLPQKIVNSGDPYQMQVGKTVSGIIQIMAVDALDYAVCYQSKVGRLEWIGPSLEEEIDRAGRDQVPVVVVPVSFVSEHSETLVELDIEYRAYAKRRHVPAYFRAPALGTEPFFIEALADMCLNQGKKEGIASENGSRFCSRNFEQCLCKG